MNKVSIIGIGSATGLDQAGWLALRELKHAGFARNFPSSSVSLYGHRNPIDLPTILMDTDLAIILDAMEGPLGSLQRFDRETISLRCDTLSSHGFGIGQALELCYSLGHSPMQIAVYGLGIGIANIDNPLAPPPISVVKEGMPAITHALQREISGFLNQNVPDLAGKAPSQDSVYTSDEERRQKNACRY